MPVFPPSCSRAPRLLGIALRISSSACFGTGSSSPTILDSVRRLLIAVFVEIDGMLAGVIRPVWIELCQKARVDPHELVSTHTDAILDKVFSAIDASAKVCLSRTQYTTAY